MQILNGHVYTPISTHNKPNSEVYLDFCVDFIATNDGFRIKLHNYGTVIVTLADEDRLFTKSVVIKGINLIPFDSFEGKMRVCAKIRYRHAESPAFAEITGKDEITLTFDEPQRAPAPGQSAVIYDGEYVIGGGVIK